MSSVATHPSATASDRSHAFFSAPLRIALLSAGELYGGVEQFLFSFALFLQNDPRVRAVVVLLEEGVLSKKLRNAGLPVEVIPSRFKYDPTAMSKITHFLKDRKIDVLHCHGYKATILGSAAAFFCGVKTVETEHGWIHAPGEEASLKLRINEGIEAVIKRLFVNRVVYVTEDLRKRKSEGRDEKRSTVIHNGIFVSPPIPQKGISKRSFRIGVIGRLCPVKGHAVLFDALKKLNRLDDKQIWVIGDGPLRENLKTSVRAQGLEAAVSFLGFRENLAHVYDELDCLVMPSFYEGLPLTLLEAMRAGVPIIASRVGGIGEILADHQTALLFPPGDSAFLAQCIESLASDQDMRQRLAMNAREYLRNRLRIDQMAEKYIDLYATLQKKAPAPQTAVWLTWDHHRRTLELAQALNVKARVISRGRFSMLDPIWPLVKTLFYLVFHRHKIVLIQNPSLIATTAACLLKKVKKFRVVQDLHSYFAWYKDRPRNFRDRVYQFLSAFCIRHSDISIVTNEILKNQVEEMGGRGVVLQDKIPTLTSSGASHLNKRKSVVYVCTYSEDEPIETVFGAARLCGPDVTLFITGKITDPTLIHRKPANVVLTDYLPEDRYLDLLGSAHAVMALTTHEHTLLCGAYEAVALSKPLILSRTQALREYFYKGVVFSDNTAPALAQAIQTALEKQAELTMEARRLRWELEEEWDNRFQILKTRLDLLITGS